MDISHSGKGSDSPTHLWFLGPTLRCVMPMRERLITLLQGGLGFFWELPPTRGLTDEVGHRFSSSEKRSLDPKI